MSLGWEKLEISQAELDEIFELNIFATWAISLSYVFLLKQSKYVQSLLFTESSFLFIGIVLLFPINLLTFRKLGLLNTNASSLFLILISTGICSTLVLIVLNYYLWQKTKKLKVLAKIFGKVAQYNDLISNLEILASLNSITNDNSLSNSPIHSQALAESSQDISELKTVLNLTKKSLLKSLELESFIYRHQKIKGKNKLSVPGDRYQLLANLEHNLLNLSVSEIDSTQEYQQLLQDAVAIGLSVHQEMRKIETIRRSLG